MGERVGFPVMEPGLVAVWGMELGSVPTRPGGANTPVQQPQQQAEVEPAWGSTSHLLGKGLGAGDQALGHALQRQGQATGAALSPGPQRGAADVAAGRRGGEGHTHTTASKQLRRV